MRHRYTVDIPPIRTKRFGNTFIVHTVKTEARLNLKIIIFSGEGRHIKGQGHGNQVNGMRAARGGALLTCGIDDTLRRAAPQAEGIHSTSVQIWMLANLPFLIPSVFFILS